MKATGSATLPKFFGSYELELHPIWNEVRAAGVDCLIDVGAAEGYYAVGLLQAGIVKSSVAFDTDPVARRMLAEMAKENGVSDRIVIQENCDAASLVALRCGSRSLLLVDCEGYETALITAAVAAHFRNSWIVVECHDHLSLDATKQVSKLLAETHEIRTIRSMDDWERPSRFSSAALETLSPRGKILVLSEGRSVAQTWVVAMPRQRGGVIGQKLDQP